MGQVVNPSPLQVSRKTVTFDDGVGTGDIGAVPIFTVTGEILVEKLVPYCITTVTEEGTPGGATLSLGVTGGVDDFIAATTALSIDADMFWVDNAPDPNSVALPAALQNILTTDNIIGTVATDELNAGAIEFTLYWRKISSDGAVVAS